MPSSMPTIPIYRQIQQSPKSKPPHKRNRHTITLVLSQLSDLKVEEGQRINVGDIISDRTTERTKLQAKKQRLEASLTRAKLPLKRTKTRPSTQVSIRTGSTQTGSV